MSTDGNSNPFKYFIAGGFGGVCTVLVGHPLDTIKVCILLLWVIWVMYCDKSGKYSKTNRY